MRAPRIRDSFVTAFKADWLLGTPLVELAAMCEFRNIHDISREAERLGLDKRISDPSQSCARLIRGRWVISAGIQVWIEGKK